MMASLSISKAIAASVTIFVTTADDALWLVPFVASSAYNGYERALHALAFVFTLQLVVFLSAVLANVTKLAVNREIEDALPLVGAIVSWIIALYLYFRTILKRRKRKEEAEARLLMSHNSTDEDKEEFNAQEKSYGSVGMWGSLVDASEEDVSSSSNPQQANDSSKAGFATVFTLTLMGALDELTYFPSLIIGGTFTAAELALGAFIACIVILVVITSILSTFQPVLELMDKVPLYAIVSIFATILTIEALTER